MTGARADAFTELLKRVIGKSANASPKNAVLLACVCVPLAVTTSVALRDVDHVHYLPLFGAVMATALVGSRTATLFVIGVSIAADLAMKGRSDLFDAAVGTGLFIAPAVGGAEDARPRAARQALRRLPGAVALQAAFGVAVDLEAEFGQVRRVDELRAQGRGSEEGLGPADEAAAHHVEIIVSEALQIMPGIYRGYVGTNADQLQIVCTASPAPFGLKRMQAVQRVC
mgnify:CR=1 FL=1